MKDPDIIRTVAEFDGWRYEPLPCDPNPEDRAVWTNGVKVQDRPPPYLTSLDAIVPVTEKLCPVKVWDLNGPDRWREYREQLEQLSASQFGGTINATARQRCEALLRTLSLWRD